MKRRKSLARDLELGALISRSFSRRMAALSSTAIRNFVNYATPLGMRASVWNSMISTSIEGLLDSSLSHNFSFLYQRELNRARYRDMLQNGK